MDQRFIRSIITAIKSLTHPTVTLFLLPASACVHPSDDLLTEKEVAAVMDKFDQGWKEKNAAVVNTIWKRKGIYHGETFDDRQRCSVTIVKLKRQVRILAEHCTPIR